MENAIKDILDSIEGLNEGNRNKVAKILHTRVPTRGSNWIYDLQHNQKPNMKYLEDVAIAIREAYKTDVVDVGDLISLESDKTKRKFHRLRFLEKAQSENAAIIKRWRRLSVMVSGILGMFVIVAGTLHFLQQRRYANLMTLEKQFNITLKQQAEELNSVQQKYDDLVSELNSEDDVSVGVTTIKAPLDIIDTLTPLIQIEPVKNATSYQLNIMNLISDGGVGKVVYSDEFTGTSVRTPSNILCPDIPYSARVVAMHKGLTKTTYGDSSESALFSIDLGETDTRLPSEVTRSPHRPEIIAPQGNNDNPLGSEANPLILRTLTPTLTLSKEESAISYGFFIRDLDNPVKDKNKALVLMHQYNTSNSLVVPYNLLKPNNLYKWNGSISNCAGTSYVAPQGASYFMVVLD